MATKAKKKATEKAKSPSKYLYALVWRTGLIHRTATTVKELRFGVGAAWIDSGQARVARYVLESSIRPGGK